MKTPSWFPAAFAVAMAGVGLGGYWWLRRQNLALGSGDLGRSKIKLVPTIADIPPMIDETKANGMTVRHYRETNMPIEKRVALIQDLVWKSVKLPHMRKLALAITRKCPERDGQCEAKAIYDAVKRRIRYTGDGGAIAHGAGGPVEGFDYFMRADRVWEFGGEDCDGHNILLATLLALNGITPRLRVTAEKNNADYGHIYVVAGLPKNDPKQWKALDTTLPGKNNFGKEAPFGKGLDFIVKDYAA